MCTAFIKKMHTIFKNKFESITLCTCYVYTVHQDLTATEFSLYACGMSNHWMDGHIGKWVNG